MSPAFRAAPGDDPVVPGAVALHRREVYGLFTLLEAAFDLALSQERERALGRAFREDFALQDLEGRRAWLQLIDPLEQLAADEVAQRTEALQQGLRRFRAAVDERLRRQPNADVHRVVSRLLQRRHEVVWSGEPAVYGTSLEAWLDATVFLASLARNELITLTPGQREALALDLGGRSAALSGAARETVAGIEPLWRSARATWDARQPAALRREAMVTLASLLAPDRVVEVPPPGQARLPALLAVAEELRSCQSAYDAVALLARNPVPAAAALRLGLGLAGALPRFPRVK